MRKIIHIILFTVFTVLSCSATEEKVFFEIKNFRKFIAHENRVYSLAIFPDGMKIVTCGQDGKVKIWDTTTLKQVNSLEIQTDSIWSVDIDSSGEKILRGCGDGSVKVWNALDYSILFADDIHDGAVFSVNFLNNSKNFFTAGKDGVIRYWDGEKFKVINQITVLDEVVMAMAVSKDNKVLCAGYSNGDVKIFLIDTLELLTKFNIGEETSVYAVDISSDNKTIAVCGDDGKLTICNVEDGIVTKTMDSYALSINSIKFLYENKYCITGDSDGKINIWKLNNGKKVFEIDTQKSIYDIELSYDEKTVAISGDKGNIILFNLYGKVIK